MDAPAKRVLHKTQGCTEHMRPSYSTRQRGLQMASVSCQAAAQQLRATQGQLAALPAYPGRAQSPFQLPISPSCASTSKSSSLWAAIASSHPAGNIPPHTYRVIQQTGCHKAGTLADQQAHAHTRPQWHTWCRMTVPPVITHKKDSQLPLPDQQPTGSRQSPAPLTKKALPALSTTKAETTPGRLIR